MGQSLLEVGERDDDLAECEQLRVGDSGCVVRRGARWWRLRRALRADARSQRPQWGHGAVASRRRGVQRGGEVWATARNGMRPKRRFVGSARGRRWRCSRRAGASRRTRTTTGLNRQTHRVARARELLHGDHELDLFFFGLGHGGTGRARCNAKKGCRGWAVDGVAGGLDGLFGRV